MIKITRIILLLSSGEKIDIFMKPELEQESQEIIQHLATLSISKRKM